MERLIEKEPQDIKGVLDILSVLDTWMQLHQKEHDRINEAFKTIRKILEK